MEKGINNDNNSGNDNDYRPVAPTSHIMNVLERHLLAHLNKETSIFQDTLQFAYRRVVGVEDAVIQLLQRRQHCEDHALQFLQCI